MAPNLRADFRHGNNKAANHASLCHSTMANLCCCILLLVSFLFALEAKPASLNVGGGDALHELNDRDYGFLLGGGSYGSSSSSGGLWADDWKRKREQIQNRILFSVQEIYILQYCNYNFSITVTSVISCKCKCEFRDFADKSRKN
jgi:hypothetical protein